MSKSLGSMYITYVLCVHISPIDIETKNHQKNCHQPNELCMGELLLHIQ